MSNASDPRTLQGQAFPMRFCICMPSGDCCCGISACCGGSLAHFPVRVIMNPLLFLFVFTYIFPRIGQSFGSTSGGAMNFGTVLLPGLMAVAIMFTGIAAVALPLSTEFGITREIDDRVMCPLPVSGVAIEKICFSALQCILSALIVFPLAYFIPSQPVHVHVSSYWLLGFVIVLASLVSGALGLTIGTSVEPRQIGLIFSVVVVPITFLGACIIRGRCCGISRGCSIRCC